MIKVIKKQPTGTFNATRRKGNYLIGESTVNYGPTEVTGFYGAIEPPEGGFTLYMDKETGGPSIKVFDTQQKLIDFCNEKLGSDQSTIFDTIDWINQQDDYFVDPNYFEFSVKTDNTGTSSSNQFQLPLISSGDINFLVDWGDGNTDTITTYNQSETTHTYTSGGTYTIKIAGIIKGFRFNNGGDRLKMLNISNWGCLDISTDASFRGCENMTCSAVDAPIISTTSLAYTFARCYEFDGPIGNWDVSNVTSMSNLFRGEMGLPTKFNQPLNDWNVSNVTNMGGMFFYNTSFDQPLNKWNTSSVTNMSRMFGGRSNTRSIFNQDIGNWDVSNVINMDRMFLWNSKFNNGGSDSIKNWNTSANTSMVYMFYSGPFNQPIGSWDVSNVTRMDFAFGYSSFNQDISNWNVSGVTNMEGMFFLNRFNHDISNWDMSNVTNISRMFDNNNYFNQPIGSWDVSNVTNMSRMFWNNEPFNQDISSWDINQVTNFTDFKFSSTGFTTNNYDVILVAWEAQTPQSNININFGGSKYTPNSAAATARQSLIDNYNWTITDGGPA